MAVKAAAYESAHRRKPKEGNTTIALPRSTEADGSTVGAAEGQDGRAPGAGGASAAARPGGDAAGQDGRASGVGGASAAARPVGDTSTAARPGGDAAGEDKMASAVGGDSAASQPGGAAAGEEERAAPGDKDLRASKTVFMNSFFFERLLVTSRVFTYDNVRRWTKGYDFFAMNQVKQLGLNRPRYCLLHF